MQVAGVGYPSSREIRDLFTHGSAPAGWVPEDLDGDSAPITAPIPAIVDVQAAGADQPNVVGDVVSKSPAAAQQVSPAPVLQEMPVNGDLPQVWGGRPVPLPRIGGAVQLRQEPAVVAGPQFGALPSYRVGEMVSTRGKTRRDACEAILKNLPGLPGRRVVVASLFGGIGASTLATLVAQVWVSRGRPSVVVDGTGHWWPGAVERSGSADGPIWGDDGSAPVGQIADMVANVARPNPFLLRSRLGPAISGLALGQAARAISYSAPLVVADIGAGAERVLEVLRAARPDLLLLACRPDRVELQQTAEFLRSIHQGRLLDCQQSALVVATGPHTRWSTDVQAAMAVVSDVAAGAVNVPFVRRLSNRFTQVNPGDAGQAVEVVAAAVAIAPPTHP